MDLLQLILTIVLTVVVQSIVGVLLGIRLLNVAFDKLSGFFGPAISRTFGEMGKKSGESRRNKALENKVATSIINKQIGPFKIIADKVLGLNIDELIDEYGAMEVLNMAQQFLPMLQGMGLNPQELMGQLSGVGNKLINPKLAQQRP